LDCTLLLLAGWLGSESESAICTVAVLWQL
jgi:hypothetical protein